MADVQPTEEVVKNPEKSGSAQLSLNLPSSEVKALHDKKTTTSSGTQRVTTGEHTGVSSSADSNPEQDLVMETNQSGSEQPSAELKVDNPIKTASKQQVQTSLLKPPTPGTKHSSALQEFETMSTLLTKSPTGQIDTTIPPISGEHSQSNKATGVEAGKTPCKDSPIGQRDTTIPPTSGEHSQSNKATGVEAGKTPCKDSPIGQKDTATIPLTSSEHSQNKSTGMEAEKTPIKDPAPVVSSKSEPESSGSPVMVTTTAPSQNISKAVNPQEKKMVKILCKVSLVPPGPDTPKQPTDMVNESKPGTSGIKPIQVKSISVKKSSNANVMTSTAPVASQSVAMTNTNAASSANQLIRNPPIANILNAINPAPAAARAPVPVVLNPGLAQNPVTINRIAHIGGQMFLIPQGMTAPQGMTTTMPQGISILNNRMMIPQLLTTPQPVGLVSVTRPSVSATPQPALVTQPKTGTSVSAAHTLTVTEKTPTSDVSEKQPQTAASPMKRTQPSREVKRALSPVGGDGITAKRAKQTLDPEQEPETTQVESNRDRKRKSVQEKLKKKRQAIEEENDVARAYLKYPPSKEDPAKKLLFDRRRQKLITRKRIKRKLRAENPDFRIKGFAGVECGVANCGASSLEFPGLHFFRFPKETDRFNEWAKRIGRPEFIKRRQQGQKVFPKVCSLHFHESVFTMGGSNLRKSTNAVPTEDLEFVTMNVEEDNSVRITPGSDLSIKGKSKEELLEQQQILKDDSKEKEMANKREKLFKQQQKKGFKILPDDASLSPVFTKELCDMAGVDGYHLVLDCEMSVRFDREMNVRLAETQWYHNGQQINSCEHYITTEYLQGGKAHQQLKIPCLNLQDVGIYTCLAGKETGQAATSCYVSMEGYDIEASVSEILACHKCEGQDPLLVKPQLSGELKSQNSSVVFGVKKNNKTPEANPEAVKESKGIITSSAEKEKNQVTRGDAEKLHEGIASKDSRSKGVPSTVMNKEKTGMANEGTDKGGPSTDSGKENREWVSSDGDNRKNETTSKDDKKGTTNRNTDGRANKGMVEGVDFQMVKKKKLDFIGKLGQTLAKSGKGIALACRVNKPGVTLHWFHNGKKLTPCCHKEMVFSQKEESLFGGLIVQCIGSGDDGIYTCVASDGQGSIASTSSLVTIEGCASTIITEQKICKMGKCPAQQIITKRKLEREQRSESVIPNIAKKQCRSKPTITEKEAQYVYYPNTNMTPVPANEEGLLKVSQFAKEVKARGTTTTTLTPAPDASLPPLQDYDDDNGDDAYYDDRDDIEDPMDVDTRPTPTVGPLPTHDQHVRPVFIKKLQDINLHNSVLVLLSCTLNVQSAKHDWYHNGRKIAWCPDYEINRELDTNKASDFGHVVASLRIQKCDPEDTGVYTCVASNTAGTISTSCYVSMTDVNDDKLTAMECQKCISNPVHRKCAYKKRLASDETSKPSANAASATSEPEYEKTEIDELIAVAAASEKHSGNDADKSLTSNKAPKQSKNKRATEGKQLEQEVKSSQEQPSASSSSGEMLQTGKKNDDKTKRGEEKDVREDADGPPCVTKTMRAAVKLPGKRMELKCAFESLSDTNFAWLYMGKKIDNCEHYQIGQKMDGREVIQFLLINPVVTVDMGVYTCLARRKEKVVSTSCSITMKGSSLQEYLKPCQKCVLRTSKRNDRLEKRAQLDQAKASSTVPAAPLSSTAVPVAPLASNWIPLQPMASTMIPLGQMPSTLIPFGQMPSTLIPFGQMPSTLIPLGPIGSTSLPLGSMGPTLISLGPGGSTMIPVQTMASTTVPQGAVASSSVTVKQEASDRNNRQDHSYNRIFSGKLAPLAVATKGKDGKFYKTESCQTSLQNQKLLEKGDHLSKKTKQLQRALSRAKVTIERNKEKHQRILKEKVTLALSMKEHKVKAEQGQPPAASYTCRVVGIPGKPGMQIVHNQPQPVVKKKYMVTRAMQTNKKMDPFVGMVSLKKRNEVLQKSLSSTSGKLGAVKKEVAKLESKLQMEEQKHIVAINELQKKVAELEARVHRGKEQSAYETLARQLQQNRGRDPAAYAGFLQYMAEPVQEFS